jgi:hypothetical protein
VRARHVHRVTPADVGARVSVRRVLDASTREVGDVLGELLSYDDGVLVVDGRDGPTTVREQDVLASRVVPPPPPPRRRRAP